MQYEPTTCTTVLPLSIMSISYYFISDFVRNKGTACEANTCYSPKDFADTSRIHTWSYSVNIGNIRATDVTTHLPPFCTMVQCWRRTRVFPLGIWNHCSYTGLNYPEAFSQVCSNQMLRTAPSVSASPRSLLTKHSIHTFTIDFQTEGNNDPRCPQIPYEGVLTFSQWHWWRFKS
jgi:hypothetical protein